jgi:YihY family inner membrane protein
MNIAQKTLNITDNYQRKHRFPAFIYAVIKKYGDDQAGYQAALLTYYGFLALFPLLLVATTVAGMIANTHPEVQHAITDGISNYFPVLGNQISDNVHTLHKRGLALIIGLLFTLYGARGVADAFRHGVNHIWQIPIEGRDTFPKAAAKSLSIVILGGLGLLAASISTSIAAAAGHGVVFRLLSVLVNVFVLFWVFIILLNITLPKHVSIKNVRSGAITAAVGLVTLQTLGGYLLTRQLKNLDGLYSNFALTLGLLFWIYLQTQIIYYAVEISCVRANRLWPRSLTGKNLTDADRASYTGQAKKEKAIPTEEIETEFTEDA